MAYQNPEAGKILGYIYKNPPQVQQTVRGGQVAIINPNTEDEQQLFMPGTKPDYVSDGVGFKNIDSETAMRIMSPQEYDALSTVSVKQQPGATAIPLYQPFFTPSWKGRPMTQEELFSSAAIMAGAKDAPIQVAGLSKGTVQSHMFSEDVRKGLGLPQSFNMFQGVDPTKPDWGATNWTLFNPTSSGFFGDIIQDLGPLIRPLDALGLPNALKNAVKVAIAVASGGASTAAEAGTEVASEMVAQEVAQQAMEQAVSNALSNTAVDAATSAAANVVAQGGISSLASSVQGLGNTISSKITDALGDMGIKGIAADAVKSAGMNAAKAALTGQDPLKAALAGGLTVGTVASAKDLLSDVPPGIANTVASAVGGATQAAVKGGDVGLGALSGAASAGIPEALKASEALKDVDPTIAKAVTSATQGATQAALRGQDAGLAALTNAASTGVSESLKSSDLLKDIDPKLRNVVGSVAGAVTGSAITGGDPALAISQAALSGALAPTSDAKKLGEKPSPSEAAAPAETKVEQPSFEQVISDLQNQYEATPTEKFIDAGKLGEEISKEPTFDQIIKNLQDQYDAQQETESALVPKVPADGISEQVLPKSKPLEIEIAGYGDVAAPTTEEAIDAGQLLEMPYRNVLDSYATPTEQFIDEAGLVSSPLDIEIAGYGQVAPMEYATPTEAAIDLGSLGAPVEYATPTETAIDQGVLGSKPLDIEIAGYGQVAPNEYATPTESFIDAGGLSGGSAIPSPITTAPISTVAPTMPVPTSQAPTTVSRSSGAVPQYLLQMLQGSDTVTAPAVPAPLSLQTKETGGGFQGPLESFLKQVSTGSYLNPTPAKDEPTEPQRARTMPALSYFSYGQPDEIDTILGGQKYFMAQGGLAVPLMAAGGTHYGANAKGGLNVVHHSGKPRVDFRHGDAVTGPGDGQSDDIPAMLADGEYVLDAEIVSALGNGSTKAGSQLLDKFREEIRKHKRGGGLHTIPPKAKSPLEYLKSASKSRR